MVPKASGQGGPKSSGCDSTTRTVGNADGRGDDSSKKLPLDRVVLLDRAVPAMPNPRTDRNGLLAQHYGYLTALIELPTRANLERLEAAAPGVDPICAYDRTLMQARLFAMARVAAQHSAVGRELQRSLESDGPEKALYVSMARPNLLIPDAPEAAAEQAARRQIIAAPLPGYALCEDNPIANLAALRAFGWNPAIEGVTADGTRTDARALYVTTGAAFVAQSKAPPPMMPVSHKTSKKKLKGRVAESRTFVESPAERALRTQVTNVVAASLGRAAAETPHVDKYFNEEALDAFHRQLHDDPRFHVARSRLSTVHRIMHLLELREKRVETYEELIPLLLTKHASMAPKQREDLEDLIGRGAGVSKREAARLKRASPLLPLLRAANEPLTPVEAHAVREDVRKRAVRARVALKRARDNGTLAMQTVVAHYETPGDRTPQAVETCAAEAYALDGHLADIQVIFNAYSVPKPSVTVNVG